MSDSGHGIAEGDRDRAFSAFFTSGKGNALGLGLAVSKQIIEAHGGTITVASSGPEGISIAISVPTKKLSSVYHPIDGGTEHVIIPAGNEINLHSVQKGNER